MQDECSELMAMQMRPLHLVADVKGKMDKGGEFVCILLMTAHHLIHAIMERTYHL